MVEGEQALLERLDTIARIPERWRYLYHDDEFGRTARVSDPMELGEKYEPAHWLGQGLNWDALAAGGGDFSKVHDALRTKELRWILVNDASMHPVLLEWGQRLEKEMAGDLLVLNWSADDVTIEDVLKRVNEWIDAPSDRFVCVGLGRGVPILLRCLAEDPALRDRVYAVVSIGGALQGVGTHALWGTTSFQHWMSQDYNYVALDTEMARETPYFSIGLLDPEHPRFGIGEIALEDMHFPELPQQDRAPVEGVTPVSLGVLPAHSSSKSLAARALWVFVTCWIHARILS